MANWSKSTNENWGRFTACNGSWGDCWANYYMEGTLSFSRNTSDATKAWVHGPIYMQCSGSMLGWATPSGNIRLTAQCYDVDGAHNYDYWGGKGGQCHQNFNYNTTHGDCYYALRSGTGLGRNYIGTHFIWGFTPTSSGLDWQDVGYYDYSLPDNLRITEPQGLTASFPTSITGTTSVSISGWGKASNMTGTPTTYPYASYWNFALDLLDKNKNYLAHITKNTGETKSTSFTGFGYYTASALQYTSAATSSAVTRKYNTAYYLRAYAQNSFNEKVSTDSGIIYSPPKAPSVTINSILYQPTKKNCIMSFSWSKPSDESDYKETVSYKVTSSDGTVIKDWTDLNTTYGGSLSGTVSVDNLKSGEVYTVEVRVKSTAGTSTDSDTYIAPVANAAFLGFDWDELRRTVVIRAEAPGAANCRIQAGDQPNVYNLGNKLTSGEVGTITLKDLPHGEGQALYLQAVPEASNGHQYTNEIAKVTVPVPNPILGVLTPPCDSPDEQRYIVDIVEKKADCSVTPKWQVGDRVVEKEPCMDGPMGVYGFYDGETHSHWEFKNGYYTIKAGSWFRFRLAELTYNNGEGLQQLRIKNPNGTFDCSMVSNAKIKTKGNNVLVYWEEDGTTVTTAGTARNMGSAVVNFGETGTAYLGGPSFGANLPSTVGQGGWLDWLPGQSYYTWDEAKNEWVTTSKNRGIPSELMKPTPANEETPPPLPF